MTSKGSALTESLTEELSCAAGIHERESHATFPITSGHGPFLAGVLQGVPEHSDPPPLGLVLTGRWASCPVSDPTGLGLPTCTSNKSPGDLPLGTPSGTLPGAKGAWAALLAWHPSSLSPYSCLKGPSGHSCLSLLATSPSGLRP